MIENVDISIQARSKVGRYYGPDAIRAKLNSLEGALFQNEDGQFYLRTTKTTLDENRQRVVILFEICGETAQVITQTSDHYDWDDLQHIQNPPFSIDLEDSGG